MTIVISSTFDSGNIEVVAAHHCQDIQLRIRPDHQSDFYQWFHYRVQGVAGQALCMRLLNAAGAAYPDGWPDYQAVASYDGQDWWRVPTAYINGELVIRHTPRHNSIYYAYFTPYSYSRHQQLIGRCQLAPGCSCVHLGKTPDGHDLDLLRLGSPGPQKRNIWVTARQHPGESMAQWLVEGLLERLLDQQDALSQRLRAACTFWIVPNMNPDGALRGHLRTNALGVNLNREWHQPSLARSPEVYQVRAAMQDSGVDLYLDIHGDEALPCNFIAGQAGAPHVSEAILQAEQTFQHNLQQANPDFQTALGYAPGKFGPETMTIAAFWVGHAFQCPAMTLEMPFKDNAANPDPRQGWSAARSAKLGASLLHPLAQWLDSSH